LLARLFGCRRLRGDDGAHRAAPGKHGQR